MLRHVDLFRSARHDICLVLDAVETRKTFTYIPAHRCEPHCCFDRYYALTSRCRSAPRDGTGATGREDRPSPRQAALSVKPK